MKNNKKNGIYFVVYMSKKRTKIINNKNQILNIINENNKEDLKVVIENKDNNL